MRRGRSTERFEERSIPILGGRGQFLRMPLNAEHPPPVAIRLGAFDDAVGRGRGNANAGRHTGEALMVRRVHFQISAAERGREPRTLAYVDGMRAHIARTVQRVGKSGRSFARNVLNQRSAQCDIENLQAATDGEGRNRHCLRRHDEGDLAAIAGGVRRIRFGMWRGAISRRIDILSASEQYAIYTGGDCCGSTLVFEWRNDHRQHSRSLDGARVRLVHSDPRDAANHLGSRRDCDERSTGHGEPQDAVAGQRDVPVSYTPGASARERCRVVPPQAACLSTTTSSRYPVFEKLRRSLHELLDAVPNPVDSRASLARMRETLVQARVGLAELREGVADSRRRLDAKRSELETVRRRKGQAIAITDQETVRVAERYELVLAERVTVLERKLEAQEAELRLAEDEVAAMTAELRGAIGGVPSPPKTGAPDPLVDPVREALDEELSSLERSRARSARDAEAEARLAEMKRKMGK